MYYRSIFPDILAYVQPIDDLILSEENVQVSITIVYIHYILFSNCTVLLTLSLVYYRSIFPDICSKLMFNQSMI